LLFYSIDFDFASVKQVSTQTRKKRYGALDMGKQEGLRLPSQLTLFCVNIFVLSVGNFGCLPLQLVPARFIKQLAGEIDILMMIR